MAHRNGFTLIELLAAMMASTMLLLWLGWTVGSIGERAHKQAAPSPHAALLEAWPAITAQIEGAYFVEAAADSEQLLVMPPLSLGQTGAAALDFAVGRDPDGKQTLMAEYRDPSTDIPLAPPAVLVRGFDQINVTREAPDDGERPALYFAFTDRQGEALTLSARPQSNASSSCRFDPISLTCRP